MTEVRYLSQIDAMGRKALQQNLDLQEISDYYHACHATGKQAYSDPKVPPIYHNFLAERETWKHYFAADEFPGKDPLYDCFLKALEYIETEPERHIKVESDADQVKIAQLLEIIQQKDIIIQSKDELLRVKEETLRASTALMADKDKIIKIKEGEVQEAGRLIQAREQKITEKNEVIRNREENLQQAQVSITTHERTITQKNEVIKNSKNGRKKLHKTIRENDREIEKLNNYLARGDDASLVKDFAYEDLEQRMGDEVAALRGQLEAKDDEIQALGNVLEKHRLCRLSRKAKNECRDSDFSESKETLKLENASFVKDEEGSEDGEIVSKGIKIKDEPMDY